RYLCVEMSMGQMVDDVRLAVNGERPVDFFGRTGGMVPSVNEIVHKIIAMNGGEAETDFYHQLDQAINNVGEKFNEFGKKIEQTINSPEFAQKAEQVKKQLGSAAGAAADGIAKGATFLADGIGKAVDAMKKQLDQKDDGKGGEQ
ncbi:MAG: hypothetical protein RSG96_03225, partial [Clostridia bacterium]